MSEQPFINRRELRRFKVKDGSLAVIKGESSIMTASIIDINMKGLALQYMPDAEICSAATHKLDILYNADNDFFLTDLPLESISERETICSKLYGMRPVKRYGVKFGKLTPAQVSQLDYFIRHYTKNEG
jgi:hypothetical protein